MTIDKLLVRNQKDDLRDIVSQCCDCKDFVSLDGSYITLDEEQTKEVYTKYLVSHGYCSYCADKWAGS